MKIEVDKQIYSKEVLLMTACSFTEKAYVHLSQTDRNWVVSWTDKAGCHSEYRDFENELITQQLREELIRKTNDIRKLTLARAYASTIIEENDQGNTEEIEGISDSTADASEIMKGWFG